MLHCVNPHSRLLYCSVMGGRYQQPWLLNLTAKCVASAAKPLGLYSLSGKTSYRKISWSLEAARFGFKLFQSLWHLAGTSAALLPRCLSNFRAIRPLQHPISWLRDFTRFCGKTSYRLANRAPGARQCRQWKPLIWCQLCCYWRHQILLNYLKA